MVISDANDARKRLLDAMAQKTQNQHANSHVNSINTFERPSVHDIGVGRSAFQGPSATAASAPMGIPSNFLRNLYGFLNNNLLPDTIAWDADGRSFSILDADKMETSLPMPNLYRGRFKTFKMQLEKHGFMKSSDGTRYFRPDFVKGQPQHLGDVDMSPSAVSPSSFDEIMDDSTSAGSRSPMSLECRIQFPKKRRLHEDSRAASDPSTQPFWNSLHDQPHHNASTTTSGLLCSVSLSKHRVGAAVAAPATAPHQHHLHPPSIPSLRPHHDNMQARLPSINRAFPLFGLNKQVAAPAPNTGQ
ncbi:hypothetical protein H310_02358 [Aphanomyces invadans]|uniref:HSF-type DNA-binding domain-containing protein n=1 Tax=Aphanomyces invadans TaxID=157072 RepID=A0A024UQ72_9STRA|nr:hypothetical protein H310_02358 [Aphanomyces invadans]ETW07972.1 hypothetical protein H310_02358 [Aphanomyces invadans]|eukprot:XP_008864065.1 hypothetical protein H310_02358 [Aphanomyces invadans]